MRTLARRLRPEVRDQLGLVPALRNLCDRIEEGTGLVVHRSLGPEPPALSADAELVLYPGAQEALTNVIRHAGVTEAHVTLTASRTEVELRVRDAGAGMAAHTAEASTGGIRGMRERALLIGARLEVVAAAGHGTDARLHIPR